MEIVYREIEAADADAMIEFLTAVGAETDNLSFSRDSLKLTKDSEERFIKRFKSNSKNMMLVAECNGEILGNASIEREKTARYSHRAELSIVVKQKFWGQGIGTRLMEMLVDFAKKSCAEILYLEVRCDNERALNLYRKFGFETIGIYNNFSK